MPAGSRNPPLVVSSGGEVAGVAVGTEAGVAPCVGSGEGASAGVGAAIWVGTAVGVGAAIWVATAVRVGVGSGPLQPIATNTNNVRIARTGCHRSRGE